MTDYEPLSEAEKGNIRRICEGVAADGDSLSDYIYAAIASVENQRMADYWRARALAAEERLRDRDKNHPFEPWSTDDGTECFTCGRVWHE